MAGFISFTNADVGEKWSAANWVFWSFLDCVIRNHSADGELVDELTISSANQMVELDDLAVNNPDLCWRITDSFVQTSQLVATGVSRATVDGRELEDDSQLQYRLAIADLAKRLHEFSKRIEGGGAEERTKKR